MHSLILPLLVAGTVSSLCLAGSRLQDGLELSSHADVVLFLTDNALNGRRQATGVPGEDKGVAVIAAAIFFQGTAGIGDGVVVIVSVNHPVVVALFGKIRESIRGKNSRGQRKNVMMCCRTYLRWTGSWPGPGSSWTSWRGWWGRGQSTGQPCQHTQPRSCKIRTQHNMWICLHSTEITFYL